jgi:AcrR family transcriptional regulator
VAAARDRILEAAVQALAAGGIDDVRIARVARMADVSPALVIYHFQTREALLGDALEASYELAGAARADAGADAADRPVLDRLQDKLDSALPAPGPQEHEWELWMELWARAARDPALRTTAARVYARWQASVQALIEEGVERGEFAVADSGRSARRLLALIDGLGVRVQLEDPELPAALAREELRDVLRAELNLAAARGR